MQEYPASAQGSGSPSTHGLPTSPDEPLLPLLVPPVVDPPLPVVGPPLEPLGLVVPVELPPVEVAVEAALEVALVEVGVELEVDVELADVAELELVPVEWPPLAATNRPPSAKQKPPPQAKTSPAPAPTQPAVARQSDRAAHGRSLTSSSPSARR